MRGDFETARALSVEALREDITPDCPAPNMAVTLSGQVRVAAGDARGAVDDALHYAALFDERGLDVFDLCNVRTGAAIWALHADDLNTAEHEGVRALALAEATRNPSSMCMVLATLGEALVDDDPDASLDYLERSVALTRSGASDVLLSHALALIAVHRARRGDDRAAAEALREAMTHAVADGDIPGCAGVLNSAVTVFVALEQHETAVAVSGSVEAGAFAPALIVSPAEDRARRRAVDAGHNALGDDRFNTAHARGSTMSSDEIVENALQSLHEMSREL
jgi:hypothetical protein